MPTQTRSDVDWVRCWSCLLTSDRDMEVRNVRSVVRASKWGTLTLIRAHLKTTPNDQPTTVAMEMPTLPYFSLGRGGGITLERYRGCPLKRRFSFAERSFLYILFTEHLPFVERFYGVLITQRSYLNFTILCSFDSPAAAVCVRRLGATPPGPGHHSGGPFRRVCRHEGLCGLQERTQARQLPVTGDTQVLCWVSGEGLSSQAEATEGMVVLCVDKCLPILQRSKK